MEEIEVAILITIILLSLLTIVNMVMYGKHGVKVYNYGGSLSHDAHCNCPLCHNNANNVNKDVEQYSTAPTSNMSANYSNIKGGWQEKIQDIGVDNATKFSHGEYKRELLAKTTGSSPWTVMDHDIDSNWLGLGWGKTYRQVYAQEGARVSEGVDHQDMPSHPGLRWRCHEYIDSERDNSGASCPWPPTADQKYS